MWVFLPAICPGKPDGNALLGDLRVPPLLRPAAVGPVITVPFACRACRVIARYEWAYLPLLREERNLRLHEHLANAPDLFADMIKSVYRAANEKASSTPTEPEIARAHQAYELLTSWHTLPGTNPDGTI